jgi:hypothetical protein
MTIICSSQDEARSMQQSQWMASGIINHNIEVHMRYGLLLSMFCVRNACRYRRSFIICCNSLSSSSQGVAARGSRARLGPHHTH